MTYEVAKKVFVHQFVDLTTFEITNLVLDTYVAIQRILNIKRINQLNFLVFDFVWSLPQENVLVYPLCILQTLLNLTGRTIINIVPLRTFSRIENFHEVLVESLIDVLDFEFGRLIRLIIGADF